MKRNWVGLCMIVGLTWGSASGMASAAEREFPSKSIEIICPFGAGGSTSMGARIIAGAAGETLGRPVIVVNKPAGGGSVGGEFVAKAKPDGYTLLAASTSTNGINPAIKKLGYKNSDFEFLGQYAIIPMMLVVKSDAPWKSLEEIVAYAKAHPNELKGSTAGVGASDHFAMVLFNEVAGVKITYLPFMSAGEEVAAILGGHAQVGFLDWRAVKGAVEGGKMRVLAQGNDQRLKEFPDIPTFAEKGYPRIKHYIWQGIAAPAGLPKGVSGKLKEAFSKAFQNKDVVETLSKIGFTPSYQSAEDFSKFVREEEQKFQRIVRETNMRVE